jgi:hypothetical protein
MRCFFASLAGMASLFWLAISLKYRGFPVKNIISCPLSDNPLLAKASSARPIYTGVYIKHSDKQCTMSASSELFRHSGSDNNNQLHGAVTA